MEGASLYVNSEAPGITGVALQGMIERYRKAQETIVRLTRRYPNVVLDKLIYQPALKADDLLHVEKVKVWVNEIIEVLNRQDLEGTIYKAEVVKSEDELTNHILFTVRKHGVDKIYSFDEEFFGSIEYKSLVDLGVEIQNLLEEGAYIQRGDRTKPVDNFIEAVNWLMHESKRGLYIQRYKGLGEMNPSQLWETTMDPSTRHMLQVTVDDAVGADQLFTTLMGDNVEPRRAFIEKNALRVGNIDI